MARTTLTQIRRDLVAALRGDEQDFTTGSISRGVLILAVPMMLELVFESVFAVVDVFFVARLGAEAVAAVGVTEVFVILIFAGSVGLGAGATAMVARRTGEGDHAAATLAAGQAIFLGVICGCITGVVGVMLAPKLLGWMGASDEVIAIGTPYTTVMLGTSVVIYLLFVINAAFRGAGEAAVAMKVLTVANLINIVLDPCLIFGLGPFPELGLEGAAWATVIGRGTGVAFQIWILVRSSRLHVELRHLVPDPKVLGRLARVSSAAVVQYLLPTGSWIAIIRLLAVFGDAAIAGYTIAWRIGVFVYLPAWGLSNAAATMVGQNLGAKKPDRAERAVWFAGRTALVYLTIPALAFLFIPETLMRFFNTEASVVAIGATLLFVWGLALFPSSHGLVALQGFNGAGDTTTPMIINGVVYWLCQIPIAVLLAFVVGLDERGVLYAVGIAETTLAIISIVLFRRGRWKTKMI
ncbi:MAG: MATE family efflux transporter [Acidobacteriota bacterium]